MKKTFLLEFLVTPIAACIAIALPGCSSEAATPKAEPEAVQPKAAEQQAAVAEAGAEEGDAHAACIHAGTPGDGEPSGCPHGEADPGAAPSGEGHFGAPFSLETAQSLAEAITATDADKPVLVEATVDAVCQKKGCWMVIKDGMTSARVLMKDHAFAVPMDARGKKAIVEGTLASRTFTEAQVKHLEQDAGKDPAKVAGERKEYVLTASAIEIKNG